MKDKNKVIAWLCLTLLVGAGLRYVPSYLVQQRALDLQERALDLREEAFLRQRTTPTVAMPQPAQKTSRQLL